LQTDSEETPFFTRKTPQHDLLRWLKGSSEEDTLARAIANGDQKALTAALKSGKVQVKKRQ
jgi:hypothetical protein